MTDARPDSASSDSDTGEYTGKHADSSTPAPGPLPDPVADPVADAATDTAADAEPAAETPNGAAPQEGSSEGGETLPYGDPRDGQDYLDRSKLDFDPADGLITGTAVEGTSRIPGEHENQEDIPLDADEGNDGSDDGEGNVQQEAAEGAEASRHDANRTAETEDAARREAASSTEQAAGREVDSQLGGTPGDRH